MGEGAVERWTGPLERLHPDDREALVAALPEETLRRWAESFGEWAHAGQTAPAGADWRTWVIMGGRGFGKTRAGAEWVLEAVRAHDRGGRRGDEPRDVGRGLSPAGRLAEPGSLRVASAGSLRIALVAATVDEARSVMVEGPSGLLALARPGEISRWVPGERRLVFANGAACALFSGRSPAKLRGPEHDLAWCDELAKWRHAGETWDMLQMGLRRGARPRCVVTTTPSADPALARVLGLPDTVVTGGATRANGHLAPGFVAAVERQYGGTRLGAQEIEGLLPREHEGSLWPWALIEASRRTVPTTLVRVVVGVDPPATAAGTCGIVVAGLGADGGAVVLADASVAGASPEGWARAVAEAAAAWEADRVVAEVNQGGDMVRSVLAGAGRCLPIRTVRATRGKATRAEPVAALFETGRATLGGRFPALEAAMAQFTAGGYAGGGSPDRADAMVWALWALLLDAKGAPGVRGLDFSAPSGL